MSSWSSQNKKNNGSFSAKIKFKEAQNKFTASLQKHMDEYKSSSDEENELQSEKIIDNVIKGYKKIGGTNESLDRTEFFLQEFMSYGMETCLICISRIKHEDSVWNCLKCFCILHLGCIQKWSKESILQQQQILNGPIVVSLITLSWFCPKCRHIYQEHEIPDKSLCFCSKTVNPKREAFLFPHSCGEICAKVLQPVCGHKCLLLCHPGPCSSCPATIQISCYCGNQPKTTRRCSEKYWSCGKPCNKILLCGKHRCPEPCHAGECNPCLHKSLLKCLCQSTIKLRDCSDLTWQCEKICNKLLSCGNHNCTITCHDGNCAPCPLENSRTCFCGKSTYSLPCTAETPTCSDTCDKLLDCQIHKCNKRCHKGDCGVCLETVKKTCKCQLHSKDVQCYKPYTCETKCKRMKNCNKHPCNKKCCDMNCFPCDKLCKRTLNCGNHKCSSVCHAGLCFPCTETQILSCRCGQTQSKVPCGRKNKTKPPKCNKFCAIPPRCHHSKLRPHRCHFGDCPPCKQICKKVHPTCIHLCESPCHSATLVKIQSPKPSMPWEQVEPQMKVEALPCPNCEVSVPVTCFGDHETIDLPCYRASTSSCHKKCGRLLSCENHTCSLECHIVENASSSNKAGTNCESCDAPCDKLRPPSCQHQCLKPCHSGPCPPCKQMIRILCHCGLTQLYVICSEWSNVENRNQLASCENQCPKNYDCGHRCRSNCHFGPCPDSDLCKRKVRLNCPCRRLKKDFTCERVRTNQINLECDEICILEKTERKKNLELANHQKQIEAEILNKRELAKYNKLFEGKKKKGRAVEAEIEKNSRLWKYCYILFLVLIVLIIVMLFNQYYGTNVQI